MSRQPSKKPYFTGKEPSPKGFGYCARHEKEGNVRKGTDGHMWVVRKDSLGRLSWRRTSSLQQLSRRAVSAPRRIAAKSVYDDTETAEDRERRKKMDENDAFEGVLNASVRSFDDLVAKEVKMMKRLWSAGIWFDDETSPHFNDLLRINQSGFITIQSQPGLLEYDSYISKTGEWICLEQRSFVSGYCRKSMALSLLAFLCTQPVYVKMIILTPFESAVDTFPHPRFNLTRDKSHKDKAQLHKEPWRYHTNERRGESRENILKELASTVNYATPHVMKIIEEECMFVSIASKEYGKGSIFEVLRKYFQSQQKTFLGRLFSAFT
jgi:hypothetical protein